MKAIPMDKVQPGFAKAAIKAAQEGYPVFSVSADLQGSTGIAAFQKEFEADLSMSASLKLMQSVQQLGFQSKARLESWTLLLNLLFLKETFL